MKYFLIFSLMISVSILAQEKTRRIPITMEDGTKAIVEVDNRDKKITPKSQYSYTWYKAKSILHTEGAYQGDLLHGVYQENYPSKQLKVQGKYRYGLKNGIWRYWDKNGKLIKEERWKNGALVLPKVTENPKSDKKESTKKKKKKEEKKEEKKTQTKTTK